MKLCGNMDEPKSKDIIDLTNDDGGSLSVPRQETSRSGNGKRSAMALRSSDASVPEEREQYRGQETEDQEEEEADAAGRQLSTEELYDLQETFFGSVRALIVGCRYYNGVVHAGEFVTLVREPFNPYDSNAIRVDNMDGDQVGHIKRETAFSLAPVLDGQVGAHSLRVEATIPRPSQSIYQMPVLLDIFGQEEDRASLLSHCRRKYLPLIDENGVSFLEGTSAQGRSGPRTDVERKRERLIANTRRGEERALQAAKSQKELDDLFEQLSSNQASVPQLDGQDLWALRSCLLPYQRDGVAWMLQRERLPDGGGLPPFWEQRREKNKLVFYNSITHSSRASRPKNVHGGLLLDEMGLGKTLSVLTVITANSGLRSRGDIKKKHERKKTILDSRSRRRGVAKNPLVSRGRTSGKGKQKSSLPTIHTSLDSEGSHRGDEPVGSSKSSDEGGTLVICPLSVISSWTEQIETHLYPGTLNYYIYHGSDRIKDPEILSSFDLVLSSYGILASEIRGSNEGGNAGGGEDNPRAKKAHKTEKKHTKDNVRSSQQTASGLISVEWRRVVLDEAHTIRNRQTKYHKAALQLRAKMKWGLTGTPFLNKVEDTQSLMAFLEAAPLNDAAVWNRSIRRPIQRGEEEGLSRFRLLLKSVSLRRTKRVLDRSLPEKVVVVQRVSLDGRSQAVYDTLFQSARQVIQSLLERPAAGSQGPVLAREGAGPGREGGQEEHAGDALVLREYRAVVECLLRLRQACCAVQMVPEERLRAAQRILRQLEQGMALDPETAQNLLKKLQETLKEDQGADCAICLEPLVNSEALILSSCAHTFCSSCIERVCFDAKNDASCPLCRSPFSKKDLKSLGMLEKDKERTEERAGTDVMQHYPREDDEDEWMPPKIQALLVELSELESDHLESSSQGSTTSDDSSPAMSKSTPASPVAPTREKCVVFSQFTSFLDIIGRYLNAYGFSFTRIDGSMSAKVRAGNIELFRKTDGPSIMLVSTKAGGVGLNLTCASRVFMCDQWWNAAMEEQAMDRVHRLGQTRPVKVTRFVCSRTVEERVIELQEGKKMLGKGLLQKLKPEELRQARVAMLRKMFEEFKDEHVEQNEDGAE